MLKKETVFNTSEELAKIYRSLVESLPVCIKVLDMEGKLIFINKYGRWEHGLEGKTEKDISKWDYLSCAREEDRPAAQKAIQMAMAGQTSSFEVQHVPGMSRHGVCFATFSLFRVNGDKYIFILSHDITLREEEKKELKEKRMRLEDAERIAHVGNFDWDVVKNKAIVSDELFRILGVKENYFNTSPFDKFLDTLHPDDRIVVRRKFEKALSDGQSFEYEARVVRPDKKIRMLHSRIEVTTGGDRKVVRMSGILQDITERKDAEKALTDKMEEMERINKHMIGRELKMMELKKEIASLKKQLSQKK